MSPHSCARCARFQTLTRLPNTRHIGLEEPMIRRFRQLPLSLKLTLAFLTLVVFAGASGAVGLTQLKRLDTISNGMKSNWLPCVKLGQMATDMSEFRGLESQHMLSFEPGEKTQIEQ